MRDMKPPESFDTARLLLRVPAMADAESIFQAYAQDSEVTRFMTWRAHKEISETEQFISGCIASWKDQIRFPYCIVLKNRNELVGMIDVRIASFRAEVGFVLSRQHWGQGIMTEATRTLVDWVSSQPQIYRVWAVCDMENVASARVLEKVGMQREGILRRYIMHPNVSDEPRDCYCYAIVK